MKDQLIAYCGLNCKNCDARIATINDDDALREKTAKCWSELNNEPSITPDTINCLGCRADGVKTIFCESLCQIRQCCMGKGYETCGDCSELHSCDKIKMITDHNDEALDNLFC